MRRSGVGGITLVEILVALDIGLSVLGLIAGLVSWSASAFRRTDERIEVRERSFFAITLLRTALADAWHFATEPDGSGARFEAARGLGRIRWDRAAGALYLIVPGEKPERTVLSSGLRGFKMAQVGPGLVRFTLDLDRVDVRHLGAPAGTVRFNHEVWLPCIGLRDRTPWVRVLEPQRALLPSN